MHIHKQKANMSHTKDIMMFVKSPKMKKNHILANFSNKIQ